MKLASKEEGRALEPILDQMAPFSLRYCSKDIFKDGKSRSFVRSKLRQIA